VRRTSALIRTTLICLLVAPAASAGALKAQSPPTWVRWGEGSDQPRIYHAAGLVLETRSRPGDEAPLPVLKITAQGKPPLEVEGAEGLSQLYASFVVLPSIGAEKGPVVLFRSYTGGAHCCDDYKIIEPRKAGWRVRNLGMWDGSGPEPKDVDHDGHIELVAGDQRFNYRLASHAESLLPPVILTLRDGALVDISAEPRFRSYFRAQLTDARKACRERFSDIGPCLGYLAIAARAGEAGTAFALLDARPVEAAEASFQVPLHCGEPLSPRGCRNEEPTKEFKSRHDAVAWFLTDLGYLRGSGK